MTTIRAAAVSAALAFVATAAVAQEATAPAPAPAPAVLATAISAAPPMELRAPAGTPVLVEIGETISTRTHKRGDWFAIALANPIEVDGKVVLPAGAIGKGQVIDSGRSGIGGKPAKLLLAARYVEHDGRRIPLRALKLGVTGENNVDEAMAISSIPYAGVLGIFVKGGEIDITPGTRGKAKLAEDYVPGAAAAPVPGPSSNQP